MESRKKFREDVEKGENVFSVKLLRIMHDKRYHAIHLGLIILDAILVLFLLLIDVDVIPIKGETEEEKLHNKERVEDALHYSSVTLLVVFMIEIIIRIILKKKEFFHDKLEVFDAVIVTLSLILDITLSSATVNYAIRDGVLLLVLLRLWRFIRLICTINICVRIEVADKLEEERTARKEAEKENRILKEQIHNLEAEKGF